MIKVGVVKYLCYAHHLFEFLINSLTAVLIDLDVLLFSV